MCLGVPGKILDVRDDRGTRMATVDFGGVRKEICLAYLPDAAVGDYTIVHAGFALTLLDEASATETLELFRSLGLLEAELGVLDAIAETEAHRPSAEAPSVAGAP